MIEEKFKIGKVPVIIYGEKTDKVYLFIHGKQGYKEEGIELANVICPLGYQVLSIDLPKHGERKNEDTDFLPWNIVPELGEIMNYLSNNWKHISIRANSIGAYFCMISYQNENIEKALFVSPIVDMIKLINDMMMWANVTVKELEDKKEIVTNFGETLSWKYYMFANNNKIDQWNVPTNILYGENDNLTNFDTIQKFEDSNKCNIEIMKNGEHWFHTEEQLKILNEWILNNYKI